MRALVLHDFHDLRVETLDLPVPGPGDVLVRVAEVGICGSDIHGYTGENGRRAPGQVMGHEASGTVEHDPSGRYAPGDRVTFNPLVSCGECGACAAHEEQHCRNRFVIGVRADRRAAFADFVVVPERNVHRLPDTVGTREGALIEPLAVAVHAVRRARVRDGDRVLIIGGGPVGQSLVLALHDAGIATVVVSELDAGRRALCAELGAIVVDPGSQDLADAVAAAAGAPADVTFDAVGISSTVTAALGATADGGRILLVGMGSPALEIAAFEVSTREREVIGSFCYSAGDFRAAIALAGRVADGLAKMVSSVITPDETPAELARLGAGDLPAGKVLVRFGAPEG
ncbi:zinc-dependent alcohol dehydrogenase [Jiangella muralis]|uniref:zinc-dependent alcohol dehydrogenase n=1 Tax=Jiangella muralis TaxID=702383 RepID=UPI00069CFA45|nr:alcohol dehydrogenase catalytic domain-containing protein [Jiangella muralis]